MLFSKMHGAGNDYIFVNCMHHTGTVGEYNYDELRLCDVHEVARTVSDRHFGIGGDGLVLIYPSKIADAKMLMYNADGSEGAMCGNAIRCVGRFLYDNGITNKTDIDIETASGVKHLRLHLREGEVNKVTVNMGAPVFEPWRIPMAVEGHSFIDQPVMVGGRPMRATALSIGNPHWVFFVEDVDALDLNAIGALYEWHELFPKRVNTEFVEVRDGRIKVRVWERGSGETLACGTGACAAAVAACVCEKSGRTVIVSLRGGELLVRWDEKTGDVFLTGNAAHVFDGQYYF